MDVSPVIYPIEIVIGTTTATSTENQYPRVSIEQFINGITRVQGLDERYVLVTLITTGERRELWLFDMIDETIRQIGVEEAEINEVKPVARDGLIFWINKEHRKVFTYDLRTSGKLYKFTMAGNLPYSDERILAFPFTGMSLVQRGEQLVIFTNEAGEVFTDENNESTKLFFEKFDLTKHLSDDLLSVISDTYVVSSEIEQITE
jgi:hypothetical protein